MVISGGRAMATTRQGMTKTTFQPERRFGLVCKSKGSGRRRVNLVFGIQICSHQLRNGNPMPTAMCPLCGSMLHICVRDRVCPPIVAGVCPTCFRERGTSPTPPHEAPTFRVGQTVKVVRHISVDRDLPALGSRGTVTDISSCSDGSIYCVKILEDHWAWFLPDEIARVKSKLLRVNQKKKRSNE